VDATPAVIKLLSKVVFMTQERRFAISAVRLKRCGTSKINILVRSLGRTMKVKLKWLTLTGAVGGIGLFAIFQLNRSALAQHFTAQVERPDQ
jgi:hypothetical protein